MFRSCCHRQGTALALGIAVLVTFTPSLYGKVLDFQKQTLSTYLRGSYGINKLQKTGYEPGFPSTVTFPSHDGVNQDYSGEAGLGYTFSNRATLRLGLQLLYPQLTKDVSGVNASGTSYLSVSSEVVSAIPQANLEIFLKHTNKARVYFGGGAGYAITTLKNTITMTAAGSSALGTQDYIEEGTGYGIMGQAFSGFEFIFFDNVSFSLELGYRSLLISQFSSNRDSTTPIGSYNKGNALKNRDGTDRSVDLSGPWAAATLRIYIF